MDVGMPITGAAGNFNNEKTAVNVAIPESCLPNSPEAKNKFIYTLL